MKDTNTNRRTFIKASAGTAAAVALVGTSSTTIAMEEKTVPATMNNEWDKLVSVFVGSAKNAICPAMDFVLENYEGITPEVLETWRKNAGKPYGETIGDAWAEMAGQYDNLAKTIAAQGVEVVRPVPLTVEQGQMVPVGNIPMYPRDSVLAVGPYIIDTFTRMEFRRKQVWGTRNGINEQVTKTGQRYLSMPQPPFGVKNNGEEFNYLEGGDTFVLNKDILVGHSGLGSSYAGIEWLRKFLAPDGYRVHAVELTKEWLHLDCMFATPREGLFMCTPKGLKEGLKNGLPKFMKDWEMIETTKKEAKELGCNGINLSPGVTVIGSEHERIINELDKKGVKCVTVPYELASTNGGGPRCSTHPLQRVSG